MFDILLYRWDMHASGKCAISRSFYLCAFLRCGDDGIDCGLNAATLVVRWRLPHITEVL